MDDLDSMCRAEHAKLQEMMSQGTYAGREVELYHQAISVSALISALEQGRAGGAGGVLGEARRAVELFNSDVHPRMLQDLSRSVDETAGELRESQRSGRAKDAPAYEDLRRQMSTLEFARQYDDGIA